ncbi:MAG: hypothetical protein GC166_06565 [Alphaproteobacteria bacterium]|nr:hypothetical protein [Alphaproteobacteria bacterium]
MRVVRTTRYAKDLKKLKVSDDDIETMEREVADDPLKGAVIQGLKGIRKMRFRIGNRGKSSGGRSIYFVKLADESVLMLTAYAKAEKDDLSPEDRRAISKMLEDYA